MNTNKKTILLLFMAGRLVGYTKDAPWAADWVQLDEGRSTQELQRLDRADCAESKPVVKTPAPNPSKDGTSVTLDSNKGTPAGATRLEIHFDGGCRPTNPGNRYGSFRLVIVPKAAKKRVIFQNERIEFGHGTNNEAEFLALQHGLDFTLNWVRTTGRAARLFQVKLVTDSMIVHGRMTGKNKACKTEPQQRMAALAAAVLHRASLFGHHEIEWRPRKHNVALFGH